MNSDDNNHRSAPPLRTAIDFSDDQEASFDGQQVPTDSSETELQAGFRVDNEAQWQTLTPEQDSPTDPDRNDSSRKYRWLAWMVIGLLVLTVIELGVFIWDVWQQQDWLGGAWLVLFAAILWLVLLLIVAEAKGLMALRLQLQRQQLADNLWQMPVIGQAQPLCDDIAEGLPQQFNPQITEWREQATAHFNDKETLTLFEQQVLSSVDRQAVHYVTSHAAASGAMIAVSPFALMDMAIVLWRNLRMLNQIAGCYGVSLGYWGRIALIKQIARHMLYAGAGEILSDTANYAMGSSLTGKMSTRLAQGMSAGLFTARIGIKAIQQTRPMPFHASPPPAMAQIGQQLLQKLKDSL